MKTKSYKEAFAKIKEAARAKAGRLAGEIVSSSAFPITTCRAKSHKIKYLFAPLIRGRLVGAISEPSDNRLRGHDLRPDLGIAHPGI